MDNEWISVKDELPTKRHVSEPFFKEVLVSQIGKSRPVFMKYWEVKDCRFATHWMPIIDTPAPQQH